jgi:hypothetical protein
MRRGNSWVAQSSGIAPEGNTPTVNVYNPNTNQVGGGSYDAGNLVAAYGNGLTYGA